MKKLKNALSWFEIPATDIHRAKKFYESIFDIQLQELALNDNLKMQLFPVEEGTIGGSIVEHKDFYKPGYEGPLVYLNANPDLQIILDRIKTSGGKVIVPKTQISPDFGYMAVFEDCEGNRVALHSIS